MTIACTDLERSARFYKVVLGAEALPQDIGVSRWYRLNGVDINLLPNAEQVSPGEFPLHAMTMLWLEVDDLATAVEYFSRHGVRIIDPGDGQYLQIADPDGLVLEVWASGAGE